jgi:hypothetical protein
MLNTDKYKQDKHDNLTRKEGLALRELINDPRIVINKADKGSTIVVEDRDDSSSYSSNSLQLPPRGSQQRLEVVLQG